MDRIRRIEKGPTARPLAMRTVGPLGRRTPSGRMLSQGVLPWAGRTDAPSGRGRNKIGNHEREPLPCSFTLARRTSRVAAATAANYSLEGDCGERRWPTVRHRRTRACQALVTVKESPFPPAPVSGMLACDSVAGRGSPVIPVMRFSPLVSVDLAVVPCSVTGGCQSQLSDLTIPIGGL
jgi:hypothetical protein